jgi:hypothetical protein
VGVLPATISAVAATIAAIFAAVNVYLTRRNENVKWAREALVDTFGRFLDASFESKNAIKQAVHTLLTDPSSAEIGKLRAKAAGIEAEMRTLQTTLRLLTTPEVVESAQALRFGVRDYIASVDDPAAINAASDKALRIDLWRRREAFIAAAQKVLAL